jgi:hypothetical protein
MPFAEGTSVPVSRSREELHAILEKACADEIGFYTASGGRARCAFKIDGLLCAVEMPPVDREAMAKRLTSRGRGIDDLVAAEERRRWRALLLVIKAKLEAVASGISTLEEQFLANVVLANGRLLVDELRPRLKELAASANAPSLLPDVAETGGG